MNKILSIIIPTYNMEALLDQCLTSLILETEELREELDVIIVNDGSTDKSSEIAHRYADEFPETFSVIDKQNGNYGSCINAALPHIKGKYVRILDADDSYNTKEMTAYLQLLEQLNVELVITDYVKIDQTGAIISTRSFPFKTQEIFSIKMIPAGLFIAMHAVTYNSIIFKRINYHQTEGVSYTDLEWVFHPMAEVNNVYYYNRTIYRYLLGREGQTIDTLTMLKNLSHMEKGLWSQLRVYNQIPSSNPAFSYLTGVIRYRTKLLYTWGIDKNAKFDLIEFDKQLKKKYPHIYEEASHICLPVGLFHIQMPIVKMWRKVKNRKGLYLFPLYDIHIISNRLKKMV